MEKAQILSTLKEKLGTTSLSERTINTYVDNVLPAQGVEPDDAYWTTHVNILKSLEGQYNHDVAEYKRLNPGGNPPPPTENPELAAIKQLVEQQKAEMTALKTQLAGAESAQKIQAVRNSLISKAGELKVRSKAMWEDAIKGLEIKEGDTADTALESAKTAYEALQKRYIGDGAQPYGGSTETEHTVADDVAKANREAMMQQMIQSGRLEAPAAQ